jgi:hypothetical protein
VGKPRSKKCEAGIFSLQKCDKDQNVRDAINYVISRKEKLSGGRQKRKETQEIIGKCKKTVFNKGNVFLAL